MPFANVRVKETSVAGVFVSPHLANGFEKPVWFTSPPPAPHTAKTCPQRYCWHFWNNATRWRRYVVSLVLKVEILANKANHVAVNVYPVPQRAHGDHLAEGDVAMRLPRRRHGAPEAHQRGVQAAVRVRVQADVQSVIQTHILDEHVGHPRTSAGDKVRPLVSTFAVEKRL